MARGIKAIRIVYDLTGIVPALIQQSHLDKKEGWHTIKFFSAPHSLIRKQPG